jgi:hypothetical protein
MIRTTYKSKLPRGFSYPLTAKDIDESLSDLPDYCDLTLLFSDNPVWRDSEFRQIVAASQPYKILSIDYSPNPSNFDPNMWKICVYPVESHLRQQVRSLLFSIGFATIRNWIHSYKLAGWDWRYHRLELILDSSKTSISPSRFDGN